VENLGVILKAVINQSPYRLYCRQDGAGSRQELQDAVRGCGCRYEAVTLYIAVMLSMLKDALLQQISEAYKCSDLCIGRWRPDGISTVLGGGLMPM